MREAGYVTAADAAGAIGADNVGTIHRMVKTGRLVGARAGTHWYVTVRSLLDAHAEAPPILERILALGVEPKEAPAAAPGAVVVAPAKGKARRARRAS